MTNYIVNLGMRDPSSVRSDIIEWSRNETTPIREELHLSTKMNELSSWIDANGQLMFSTNDLDEAKEVARKAVKIKREFGIWTTPYEAGITISAQPQCSSCGFVGAFGYHWCPRCGDEMEEEIIDEWWEDENASACERE